MNNEEKILQILETMQNQIGTMQNQMNSMQESMDRQFSELREQMKADHLAVGEMFEKAYEKIGEVSDKVERIDKKLEDDMEEVLQIVTLGRAARNGANRKNRQPLSAMYVQAQNVLDDIYQEVIKEELNVKQLEFVDDVSRFTSYTFKPQLKILGQKYGKKVGEIRTLLSQLDGAKAKRELDETGTLTLQLADGLIQLTVEELLIDVAQVEGYATASDRGVTVVLDTRLTDELIEEGFVREIISKIQSMRKDADFQVTDRIAVYEQGSQKLEGVIRRNEDAIRHDVLADEIHLGELGGVTAQWDINGEKTTLGVQVLA